MAIAFASSAGTAVSNTAASSLALTTTVAISSGSIGMFSVCTDNDGTVDSATNEHTSVTGGTGTWTKLGEYSNANGAALAGVTVSLWMFDATGTNSSGTVFTFNFSTATPVDKAILGGKFTKTSSSYSARAVPGSAAQTQAVDAAVDFGSSTISGLTSAEHLYFRAMGKEANTTTALTPTTNFTQQTLTRSRNNAAAVVVVSEYRINTSTGETSNPTLAVSGDTASVFQAVEEYIPSVPSVGNMFAVFD